MTSPRDPLCITDPCDADWDSMEERGGGARHCAGCDELVHDIASLDPEQAAAIAADPTACLRVTRACEDWVVTRGGALVLAASLVLLPTTASAGPRAPLVDHQPSAAALERGRQQAAQNRIEIRGEIVAKPTASTHDAVPKHTFMGRRSVRP